jgi:hypothetical protein
MAVARIQTGIIHETINHRTAICASMWKVLIFIDRLSGWSFFDGELKG